MKKMKTKMIKQAETRVLPITEDGEVLTLEDGMFVIYHPTSMQKYGVRTYTKKEIKPLIQQHHTIRREKYRDVIIVLLVPILSPSTLQNERN